MCAQPVPIRSDIFAAMAEAELLTLARQHDEGAIATLVRRYNQQLFRIARSILHNDAEAEDTVQAAYGAAFTKLDSFRGEAAFSTWLARIVMNEAYGRLRRQGPVVNLTGNRETIKPTLEGGLADLMAPQPTNPESELGRTEVRRFLEAAIDSLPEPFRLTYVLRDVQEMSTREVATLLGINVVTVKTRLFRARRQLRLALNKSVAKEFSAIFPFDGARCAAMAERVIQGLTCFKM